MNQRGFEVKLAANSAEAVERISSEKPDVILLDWVMPLMDGREVLSRLDANTETIPSSSSAGSPPLPPRAWTPAFSVG